MKIISKLVCLFFCCVAYSQNNVSKSTPQATSRENTSVELTAALIITAEYRELATKQKKHIIISDASATEKNYSEVEITAACIEINNTNDIPKVKNQTHTSKGISEQPIRNEVIMQPIHLVPR